MTYMCCIRMFLPSIILILFGEKFIILGLFLFWLSRSLKRGLIWGYKNKKLPRGIRSLMKLKVLWASTWVGLVGLEPLRSTSYLLQGVRWVALRLLNCNLWLEVLDVLVPVGLSLVEDRVELIVWWSHLVGVLTLSVQFEVEAREDGLRLLLLFSSILGLKFGFDNFHPF